MASLPENEHKSAKARLLSSRELLVDSLYQLSPLLDRLISARLLSRDNCYDINAEQTPPNKARKLLEIVDAQMDESQSSMFIECLRKCEKNYPRLREWLNSIEDSFHPVLVQQGPAERHLQARLNVLSSRLGCSVLPVSLDLFSKGILTQLEFEKIQAVPVPTLQAHTLLSICQKKGETACMGFYSALQLEDQLLAEELDLKILEEMTLPEEEGKSVQIAVEETALPLSGLQQVMTQFGLAVGDEIKLNICEVGVAVGLPRHTVREHLLDGVGIEDSAQLEAVVALYVEKTKDTERLLRRVEEFKPQWVRLSDRGCLLLRLLQKAEAILQSVLHGHLQSWDHLRDLDFLRSWDYLCPGDCTSQRTVWAIFSFLIWDCMAEVVEEPEPKPSRGILGMMEQLRSSGRVEADLLQEMEDCWSEGNAESLLQSVRVLAQVLRDLHPLNEGLQLSSSVEGLFSCRPSRLHRVTSFQSVSARVIRKALSSMAQSSSGLEAPALARRYRETCVRMALLLNAAQSQKGSEFLNAPVEVVLRNVRIVLSSSALTSEAFDSGVRHRLMSVLEFDPAQLGLDCLMLLHQESLRQLQSYLQLCEGHHFQFILESVRLLGSARLFSVHRAHGPVAIDNGVEQVMRFVTSEPSSFLVGLHYLCFEAGRGRRKVSTPRCGSMFFHEDERPLEMQMCGAEVLAEVGGTIWVREGESDGWSGLQSLARRCSAQLRAEGCCFRVKASRAECEVKFIYRSGRLSAQAHKDCEVK